MKSTHNINRKLNWKRFLGLLFIVNILYILKCFNIDVLDKFFSILESPVIGKYLTLTFILLNIVFILRYIYIITIIYLISNKKIKKSIYMPFFLRKEYDTKESISKSPDLQILIDLYYKHMVLYILLLIFSVLIYYIKF